LDFAIVPELPEKEEEKLSDYEIGDDSVAIEFFNDFVFGCSKIRMIRSFLIFGIICAG